MTSGTARKVGLLATTLAVVVIVVALRFVGNDGAADGPAGPAPDDTIGHETGQSPKDVEDYWTPERMEEAEPAPMPEDE
ncbi:hypothetical protein [Streptomyces sp. ST2-7A]|uniref:hypothetical protein n=1 Tax=Streptomyces sp. ST2-7A TaxID=2907214 RepID=UPI001F2BAE09|nr:hypothetical protein [Streptomyces sp. ST2-7A]MCE7080506.1 hypothetical protein [Streptomyces sp. ST2-7A]